MTVIYSPQLSENRSIVISENDLTFLNTWGIFEYEITSIYNRPFKDDLISQYHALLIKSKLHTG